MRSRRVRGIMPIGESVPCGVRSVTESPMPTPSCAARSFPSRIASGASGFGARSASRLPCCIARPMSVTVGSSAGSIPFTVMNCSLRAAEMSALPLIAGAAPTTCGTFSSLSTSTW